jgi:hypothetical protein
VRGFRDRSPKMQIPPVLLRSRVGMTGFYK